MQTMGISLLQLFIHLLKGFNNKLDFYSSDVGSRKTFLKFQLLFLAVCEPLNASNSLNLKLQEMFIAIFNPTNVCKNASLISTYNTKLKSIRPDVFCKRVFSKPSQNVQDNTCVGVSFFNKVAGLKPETLLRKRFRHRCFPVNFAKILRTLFLQNTSSGCFWKLLKLI